MRFLGVLLLLLLFVSPVSASQNEATVLDTSPIYDDPSPLTRVIDELEELGLEVDYHNAEYDDGGIDREVWLKEIAQPENMVYIHFTHGRSWLFKPGEGQALITTSDVEEAMQTRSPYKLSVLASCGAGDLDNALAAVFTKDFTQGCVYIGGGIMPDRVEYLLQYMIDNPHRTVRDALDATGLRFNDSEHYNFFGDARITAAEMFNLGIELGEGVNIITYTGSTLPLPEALGNIEDKAGIIWAKGVWTDNKWLYYNARIHYGTLNQLETGRAYIMVVFQDCVWEIK